MLGFRQGLPHKAKWVGTHGVRRPYTGEFAPVACSDGCVARVAFWGLASSGGALTSLGQCMRIACGQYGLGCPTMEDLHLRDLAVLVRSSCQKPRVLGNW